MIGYPRGQDGSYLDRSGLRAVSLEKNFPESQIINPLDQVPSIFFLLFFPVESRVNLGLSWNKSYSTLREWSVSRVLNSLLDIDECVQDTHTCSKDGALCNNTKGSFNCTCKPGFVGDGYNCTGKDTWMPEKVWKKKLLDTIECVRLSRNKKNKIKTMQRTKSKKLWYCRR